LNTPSVPGEVLKQVRAKTCYRTLRGLIDAIQMAAFVFAALTVIVAITSVAVNLPAPGGLAAVTAAGMVQIVGAIFLALVIVMLAIASKQAALLLVDIADCKIQQVASR
jgi:hypothetical protein